MSTSLVKAPGWQSFGPGWPSLTPFLEKVDLSYIELVNEQSHVCHAGLQKESGSLRMMSSICFTGDISPDGKKKFKNFKFRWKTHHQKFFLSPKFHPIWPFSSIWADFHQFVMIPFKIWTKVLHFLFHWCHMLNKWKILGKTLMMSVTVVWLSKQ
jgi:hypothetical protein